MSKDKDIEILTKNIKWIREKNDISKKKMSEILNIGIKSLNKLEEGILPPRMSAKVLFRLQEKFKIPVCDLLEKFLSDMKTTNIID